MINITVTIIICVIIILCLPSLLDKEIHVESFNNSNSESNNTTYIYMLVTHRSMLVMHSSIFRKWR